MPLTSEDLEQIAEAKEVLIETRGGQRAQRTIVWVVVNDREVFVRSFRGHAGRWYQQAIADPEVALIVGDHRYEFRAVPAGDAASVERTSSGFRLKYRQGRSLDAMLVPEVLDTTLRLDPVN